MALLTFLVDKMDGAVIKLPHTRANSGHGVEWYWITRSSWLNCALRDEEAVYWVSIGHYEAVAVGNWWYWVSREHLCLYIIYIEQSGDLVWSGVADALQTTLKHRATQLLIKYKNGALVTQCKETRWLSGSPLSLLSARIGERERRMRKTAWPLNPSTLKPISILVTVRSTQCDILSLSPCVHPLKYLPPFEIHNSQSHC